MDEHTAEYASTATAGAAAGSESVIKNGTTGLLLVYYDDNKATRGRVPRGILPLDWDNFTVAATKQSRAGLPAFRVDFGSLDRAGGMLGGLDAAAKKNVRAKYVFVSESEDDRTKWLDAFATAVSAK